MSQFVSQPRSLLACCAATIAGLFAMPAGNAFGVLPTVNKISFADGSVRTLSLYAKDPSPPAGVTVAVGDINGDGFPDLLCCPIDRRNSDIGHTVEARSAFDGSLMSSGLASGMSLDLRLRSVITGHFQNGDVPTQEQIVVGAGGYVPPGTTGPLQLYSWSWGANPATGAMGLSDGRLLSLPAVQAVGETSVAIDETCKDGFGIVAAYQQPLTSNGKFTKSGHVTLLKRGGESLRTFTVSDDLLGGGIQVASGDLDGDGVAEICTLTRDRADLGLDAGSGNVTAPEGQYTISIFNRDGALLERNPWRGTFSSGAGFTDGEMTGRICIGDINNDGRPDVICTSASTDGPVCSVFDYTTPADGGRVWDSRSQVWLDLRALPIDPSIASSVVLDPHWTPASLDAPPADSADVGTTGTLVFGMSVVPEPATLSMLVGIALGVRRRRR